MSFFAASFIMSLKRAIKPSYALLAVFLSAALTIGGFVQKSLAVSVSIGVLQDGAEITEEIIRVMEGYSSADVVRYSERESMQSDISAGKIECGYEFAKDAPRHIENGSINRAVKAYVSPSTIALKFTNELMFAALTRVSSPYMAANYLNGKTDADYSSVLESAKKYVNDYFASDSPLKIETKTLQISGGLREDNTENSINKGILSVFLFITFFYLTISGANEKNSGVLDKLPRQSTRVYCASYVLAHALIIYLLSAPLYLLHTNTSSEAGSVIVIGIYTAALSLMSFAGIMRLSGTRLLFAAFPFIGVLVIMAGGAFFDLGAFGGAASFVQRLFPTYYFVVYMP